MRKYKPKYSKPLTDIEKETLCLLCFENADIAIITYRSIKAIRQCRNIIFKKLEVHSRAEALITAIRQGIIEIWDVVLPTDEF